MSNGGSYDPHAIEQDIYTFWEKNGYFHAKPNPDKRPYVIDIPLPNVTGALHLGHALNNTVQDILIRTARMRGREAMWMPGTDHAGIATQAVVERKLKEEENTTRHQLGRDGLVRKIWEWKEDYGGRILRQLRQIGCSCDWERTRFTLDDVCAKAVFEVFFEWFKAGLIYRGQRLVNWDAHLQTAVADDEIIHETVRGNLWQYRYPLLKADELRSAAATGTTDGAEATAASPVATFSVSRDAAAAAISRATDEDAQPGREFLAIATTRPETMLGDTAVAVHPDDERYQHLIGQYALLPLANRAIPIVADGQLVKPEFGTGCVKVTPGHDPNDYACGQRHNLEMINILTPDGHIRKDQLFGPYAGQDRYAARKQIVKDLEAAGLIEQIEDYEHEVGHSDRSKTPIEPMLSEQWFVKMADLAESAMEAVRDGRVRFFPERYAKTYLDWLGEKRDWCISRQLWWGHRIPVWTSILSDENGGRVEDFENGVPSPALRSTLELMQDYFRQLGLGDDVYLQPFQDEIQTWISICLRDPTNDDAINRLNAMRDGQPSTDVDRLAAEIMCRHEASFTQDPDVLDTWFSSALWPFSTLGWPDNYGTERPADGALTDLDYFYPTSVLVTAREIITLWVARMVMTGLYFTKRVPFQHVHIHPNIQDGQGRRMSKSIGNGVDPVDIIQQYGTDALRFTMAQMDTETQDARLPVSYLCPHCGHLTPQTSAVPHNKLPREVKEITCPGCKKPFATAWATEEKKQELGVGIDTSERFEMGRNFANKIWQVATGFVITNLDGYEARPLTTRDLALEDAWILSRLSAVIAETDRRLARYQISDAMGLLYSFFWNDFCDWYVELVKPRLFGRNDQGQMERYTDRAAQTARQVLAHVLDQSLRLMHPFMPFVTEAVWRKLNEAAPLRGIHELREGEHTLIIARWPDAADWRRDRAVEDELAALQNVIKGLRDMLAWINKTRSAAKSPAIGKLPEALIQAAPHLVPGLVEQEQVICRLGRCEALRIGADLAKPAESATKVFPGIEIYVPIAGLADLDVERKRLDKERGALATHIQRLEGKLGNEGFVSKAPPDVVQRERERLAELKDKLGAIERNLKELGE